MKTKSKTIFICNDCGYETSRWTGQCGNCKAWNTMNEEAVIVKSKNTSSVFSSSVSSIKTSLISEIDERDEDRYPTGLGELDRVLGGGIVKGSLVLLSGEPGAGKSTLLLQICDFISKNLSVLYVSGEESIRQIKLRAKRLGVNSDSLKISSDNNVLDICNTISLEKPDLVIIDSIQTMNLTELTSSPGSITQVRESTSVLMKTAKSEDIPIFLVGHVNKDGAIAGPKVLEHIVDTVLYFEGDRNLSYRILRAVKNRYGSTNEIGVFDMTDGGLVQIENPSEMFLLGKPSNVPGTCVACVIEGSRPIMAEVQALVAKTSFGTPRRASTGFDYNRMNLLLAVLEKRCGYFLGTLDVYVNVVGGLKLNEPAVDLPIALSIVSSLTDKVIDDTIIAIGEIGLTGEVRSVSNIEARISEAERLGFSKCILPIGSLKNLTKKQYNIELIGIKTIKEAFKLLNL